MSNLEQTAGLVLDGLHSANVRRRCILVLGMHRSGTSVVTRIISLSGADLPQSLIPPAQNNPRGYWESGELLKLHDQLLASGGSRWDDWDPFPRPNGTIDPRDAIQTQLGSVLQRDFDGSSLFVIKDPRICRFVPIWLEVLQQFHTRAVAVLPLRHPFEVARSLHSRNDIPFNVILESPMILHWFTENLDTNLDPKLSGIPLGLVYDTKTIEIPSTDK